MSAPFKRCSGCGIVWVSRDDFRSDSEVRLCGYQPFFADPERGFFLFTHLHTGCETTFAIPVGAFTDLVQRPMLEQQASRGEGCPQHCMRQGDLDPCLVRCECAFVRDVMQILRR